MARPAGREWNGAFSGGLGYNLSLTVAWPGMAGVSGYCPADPFALTVLGPAGHSGIPDFSAITVTPMGARA